ncbi:MAG: nucleotidyltransferase domain-containing protein [Candidatus Asgardarchaeum sp.]
MLLLYKDKVLQKILKEYTKIDENLIKIIIFGSVARDEYTPLSDIDLLIITDNKKKTRELFSDFREKLFAEYGVPITAIYVTLDEFNSSIEPLYATIKKEGKVIWRRKRR